MLMCIFICSFSIVDDMSEICERTDRQTDNRSTDRGLTDIQIDMFRNSIAGELTTSSSFTDRSEVQVG